MERGDPLVEHAGEHGQHVGGVALSVSVRRHDVGTEKGNDELERRQLPAPLQQLKLA